MIRYWLVSAQSIWTFLFNKPSKLQGCIGWLGVKLGRGEVGMRELTLQEVEEQLFDKEMAVVEDMIDYLD